MAGIESIRRANQEVLRRVNREIVLAASRFANTLLAGVFRAIFSVEKGYEYSEPEAFQLEYEPERILWSRLNQWQMQNLALAVANEDVRASRYHLFTEYDFVVIVDVSQSILLDWYYDYGGEMPPRGESPEEDDGEETVRDCTKLYMLKYTLASFLCAARANDYFSYVLLAGGGRVRGHDSRQDPHLEELVLTHIDEHFRQLVRLKREEPPSLPEAIRLVASRKRRAIVLCISDFTDLLEYPFGSTPRLPLRAILDPLAQVAEQHRLLALQVVDRRELECRVDQYPGGVKQLWCLNPECFPDNSLKTVSDHKVRAHSLRVQAWNAELMRGFADYGIKFEQLVAKRDEQWIDKKIYELGIATTS